MPKMSYGTGYKSKGSSHGSHKGGGKKTVVKPLTGSGKKSGGMKGY